MADRVENKVALITVEAPESDEPQRCCSARGAKVAGGRLQRRGWREHGQDNQGSGRTAVFHAADVSNPQDVDG